MEQFIIDQVKYGIRYLPKSLMKYPFTEKSTAETASFRSREFICGVCHPSDNYEQIKGANIGWVRFDMPFPFNEQGGVSEAYERFKSRVSEFQKNGIRVMTVTPYPRDFIANGIDPRTAEGEQRLRETARFIIKDLQGVVAGIQVTNEMGIPHFILPLNMQQAIRFIGVQLEEMYPLRQDILIGYNSAGPQADLHSQMKEYLEFCDYVGIDIYIGCFMVGGFMWMFDAMLDYLWVMTKKPIMIQEFGYISGGKPMKKSEKLALLRGYGVSSEKQAREKIEVLFGNLSEHMQRHIGNVCGGDVSRYYNLIFKSDFRDHLYKQIPSLVKIPGYDHTHEGQAKFYKHILPRLYNKPFVAGMFIYCYGDGESCHVCGQSDCPTETKWGLVTREGKEKPSYYAVKKAFGAMNGQSRR